MNKIYSIIILILINLFLFSQDIEDLEFGTDNNLDIATWNIEWFPKNGYTTLEYVSQILLHLDLDVLAMQELDDREAFDQMLSQLSDYTGYYESSWFAGLAYIYKADVVQINDIYEIYTTSPYWSAFPRSPMVMDMNFMGENYIIINNHFKCCGDGILDMADESDEEKRRYNAINLLKDYIDNNFNGKRVILLGDLNDNIAESDQNNIFINMLLDTENYYFTDYTIANGSSQNWSFPTWPSHLDHIIITDELFEIFSNSIINTIKVDEYLNGGWNEYDNNISDHRPVAISLNISDSLIGDLNNDGLIDILDIILLVNMILFGEYNQIADLNYDGVINVLDIVIYKNIILNR